MCAYVYIWYVCMYIHIIIYIYIYHMTYPYITYITYITYIYIIHIYLSISIYLYNIYGIWVIYSDLSWPKMLREHSTRSPSWTGQRAGSRSFTTDDQRIGCWENLQETIVFFPWNMGFPVDVSTNPLKQTIWCKPSKIGISQARMILLPAKLES